MRKIWNLEEDTRASEVAKLRTQATNLIKEKEERVTEIDDIEVKIEKIETSRNDNRKKVLRFTLAFADDLGNEFFNLQPNQAKKCEFLLFPNGFFVDADKKFTSQKLTHFTDTEATKNAQRRQF